MATQRSSAPPARPSGAPPKARGMNPMVAGIIIGLLLGMLIALVIALWLNRSSSNAFVEKTKPVEALPVPKPTAPATGGTDKPKYEFYDLLPADKSAAAKKSPDASTTAPVTAPTAPAPAPTPGPTAAPTPSTTPSPAQPTAAPAATATKSTRIEPTSLQVGAFQSVAEADNLKAKIAFAGLEASVKPVNVAGKGTLYRVRLGPYKTAEELNRAKVALSQTGISATVVKTD